MEHISPLIQTILWVGLIAVIVWRFHKPMDGILSGLHKRIESGSSFKAGPFELSDQLRPLDAPSQKEKVEREVREVLQAEPVPARDNVQSTQTAADAQAKYFQAEDLVLRAIQAEYGATVSRQVTAGADIGFDGVFVTNERLNIVEVKYVASSGSFSRLRETLDRLVATVTRYGWGNAQIILAVVFEKPEEVTVDIKRLQEFATGVRVPVAVRAYSFSDLQQRFGVSSQ